MGERVNIQYSVDIEDLGEEVTRLIEETYSGLRTVTLEKVPEKDKVLSLRTIQVIDEVRQQLAEVDNRLSDVVNIVNGYISYKSQMFEQQQVASHAESQYSEQLDDQNQINSSQLPGVLTSLKEKLEEFQNENAG